MINKVSLEQAKTVGDKLGVDFTKLPLEEFRAGMEVEMEHGNENKLTNVTGNDLYKTGQIALRHFLEAPNYYDELRKMEKRLDQDWVGRQKPDIIKKRGFMSYLIWIIIIVAIVAVIMYLYRSKVSSFGIFIKEKFRASLYYPPTYIL